MVLETSQVNVDHLAGAMHVSDYKGDGMLLLNMSRPTASVVAIEDAWNMRNGGNT